MCTALYQACWSGDISKFILNNTTEKARYVEIEADEQSN